MNGRSEASDESNQDYESYHMSRSGLEWLYSKSRQDRVFGHICNQGYRYIVEIGVGTYPLSCNTSPIKPRFDLKIAAIEPREGFLNNLKSDLRADINLHVFNSHFENLNIGKVFEFFNDFPQLIVVNSVLHEVEDPEKFIQKLVSMSGENTKIWVNVPNGNSLHLDVFRRLKKHEVSNGTEEDSYRGEISGRKRTFLVDEILSLFRRKGFKCVRISSYGYKPFSFAQLEYTYNSIPNNLVPPINSLIDLEFETLVGAELELVFEIGKAKASG